MPAVVKRLPSTSVIAAADQVLAEGGILGTIVLPKNLNVLSSRLPKPHYDPPQLKKYPADLFLEIPPSPANSTTPTPTPLPLLLFPSQSQSQSQSQSLHRQSLLLPPLSNHHRNRNHNRSRSRSHNCSCSPRDKHTPRPSFSLCLHRSCSHNRSCRQSPRQLRIRTRGHDCSRTCS